METKIYNFRYKNMSQKVMNLIINSTANFVYPIILCWIIMFIMALCGVLHYLSMELCLAFLGVSALLGLVFAIKYTFSYKGVILYDTYMEVITHNIVASKPKIKIQYSDVMSIYNSFQDLRFNRKKMKRNFLVGDVSYYVELTLNGGKQFCFSVENQEEFVKDVISRVNSYRQEHGLKEI